MKQGASCARARLAWSRLPEAYLARIRRLQPMLNALITITEERARESARSLDRELRDGNDRGPLHGIPITYKDNIETRGIPTTVGSALYRHSIPQHDATMVRRLEGAGTVMLGRRT